MTCPNCQAEMTERTLAGHLGTRVTIDICEPCQSFWFDGRESLQLSPAATLQLFQTIGEAAASGRPARSDTLKCPRCDGRMKIVYDLQRSTRFQYRQCPQRHGRFISFFDFLREKNFIRPLTKAQVDELRQHVQSVSCSNCGAPIDLSRGSLCAHCGSAVSMLDLKQAETLITQLRNASALPGRVDPALPLALESARRQVDEAFSFERGIDWSADMPSTDLVRAGLSAVSRWLKD